MRHLSSIALAALCVSGCLDLSLPTVAPADPGPTLQFISPVDGQLVSLTSFLQLQVTSLHGVRDLTVSCNGITVQEWRTTAPFEATVDFSNCARGATPVTLDAGAAVAATLVATAHDVEGVQGLPAKINVFLDVSTPALTIKAPDHVAPGGTLTLSITSDRALISEPLVQVEGVQATVTGDPSGLTFVATLSPTPLLGIDAYDAGGADADIPIEVLEDVERPLPITIDARGTNGNGTHLTYQVLLSRVLWNKAVPGIITASDGGFDPAITCPAGPAAVAGPGGLELPLVEFRVGKLGGRTVTFCVPGFMSAADGTFSPAPDLVTDSGTLLGFDNSGRSLMDSPPMQEALFEPASSVIDATATLPFIAANALVQVGASALCQSTFDNSTTCTSSVLCMTQDGGIATTVAAFAFQPVFQLASGNTYLSLSDQIVGCTPPALGGCPCSSEIFIGPPGNLTPLGSPFLGAIPSKVLPITDGFIASLGPSHHGLLTPAGAYTPDLWPAPQEPFAAFPDGRALTASVITNNAYTEFQGWDRSTSGPSVSTRIPGVLEPDILSAATPSGYSASDQNIVILVQTSLPPSPSAAVLLLDHALRPRWLYRYPGPLPATVTAFQALQLVGDPASHLVYLVDRANERVVALPR